MKSVVLYLVLVGTPLIGLLAILKIGEKLDAPPSVGGTWTVDEGSVQGMRRSCVPLEASGDGLEMTISQSGRYVQLRFSDVEKSSMVGRINTGTLMAHYAVARARHVQGTCGPITKAVLQLRIQPPSGGAEQLEGSWTVPECHGCLAKPFRAVRPNEPIVSASR